MALSNGAEPLTPVDLAIGATNRALLMTDMGRPQEALDLTEIALTQYRQDTDVIPTWNIRAEMARIHAAAATALADLGQPEQALARLDLALSIARESYPENHPDLATALANAADFLFVQGNKTRALSLLEEAIAINAKYAEGHLFLGNALSQLGRQHDAIDPLRRATELDGKNCEAPYRLGEAYHGMGDYRQAVEAGERATRCKKDYPAAAVLLGDAYLKLVQLEDARTWYGRAVGDSRFKDYATHQLEEVNRLQKGP